MGTESRHLNTWSEIAGYLGVGIRAAQNYEKKSSLPVKHMPGARGRVWASADDIDAWKIARSRQRQGERTTLPNAANSSPIILDATETPREGVMPIEATYQTRIPPLAGHGAHVVVVSSLYGLLWAECVFLEISYRFDDFAKSVWKFSTAIFACVLLASVAAFWINTKLNSRRRPTLALAAAFGVIIATAAGIQAVASQFLPNEVITRATFQTLPAPAAYLKNIVLYFLPLAFVFMLLPFHLLRIMLAAEIPSAPINERWTPATSWRSLHAAMRLRPRVLWGLIVGAFVIALALGSHLLDALQPGPHKGTFIELAYCRGFLFFAIALECALWYQFASGSSPNTENQQPVSVSSFPPELMEGSDG